MEVDPRGILAPHPLCKEDYTTFFVEDVAQSIQECVEHKRQGKETSETTVYDTF